MAKCFLFLLLDGVVIFYGVRGGGRSLTDLHCRLDRFVDIYLYEYEIFQSLNIPYFTKNENVSREKRLITNGSASSLGMATYAAVT